MEQQKPTVFVVDDNTAVLRTLRWLIESVGIPVETYASARTFLEGYDPDRPGCLVTDVRLPGMSGPDLQEYLSQRGSLLPVIFITGYGDVPTAVRALKQGAEDFIQKPFSNQVLLDRIQRALEVDAERRRQRAAVAAVSARVARLTAREREVARLIAAGGSSKHIAARLGISEKTVEFHRANLMSKLGVRSLAELLRVLLSLEAPERQTPRDAPRR
jgi:FixJ family two-component response regulator